METGQTVEYREHGLIEQTLPSGDVLRGRYSFPDDGHIIIALQSELLPISPVLTPIVINGDDMQLVGPDGKKWKKLKRIKDGTKAK